MAFSQPIGSAVSVDRIGTVTKFTGFAISPLPKDLDLISDASSYKSIQLRIVYYGQNPFPAATGDYLRMQILWYAGQLAANDLLWIDRFEMNSDFTPNFIGRAALLTLPVKGRFVRLNFATVSGAPVSPTVDITMVGSPREVPTAVFHNDEANYKVTDLVVLSRSGGVLAPGVADTLEFGGLASGPAYVRYVAVFAAANVSCRFRGFWGSDTVYGPEDIILTSSAVNQTLSTSRLIQLPRRPLRMFAQNITGAGNVTSYNFSVIRDEP